MEITKKALDIIKEQNTTIEENRCMQDYCDALVEIEAMKKELSEFKGQMTNAYKLKKKRTEILEKAVHSFHDSYFSMAKYKQMWSQEKQQNIEKEIAFISAIAKASR
tara:strand:+ start:544 stop:864 length:321 start_codon:yes stop_codon:yes gene_type:complete